MPLVSVIIPTKNRKTLVQRALKSVLDQSFQDFELIVVDDGSTDNTMEILRGFGSRISVLTIPNSGVSSARNAGIKASSGPLVAFLDSDDQWLPTKLEKQAQLFLETGRPFICHTDEIWIRNGREIGQKLRHHKQGGRFFERSLERCLISPSSVIISRDLFEKVGLFDPDLPAAEDYDLWLRITAFYEVRYIPEKMVIKYGGHPDQLSLTTEAIDRFRIMAIQKILANNSLASEHRLAAIKELERKCSIVAAGAEKRGRLREAEEYLEIPAQYKD